MTMIAALVGGYHAQLVCFREWGRDLPCNSLFYPLLPKWPLKCLGLCCVDYGRSGYR